MQGDTPRPGPAIKRWVRSWSALLILLLAFALTCAGGEPAFVGGRPARSGVRYVVQKVVAVPVTTPAPVTPPPTPAPTPEPTPVSTPPPPPPTALPEPPAPRPPAPVYVPPPAPPPASAHNEISRSVMVLINDRRAGSGLPVLWPNAALNNAAQGYAEFHFAAAPYQLSHTLDGTPGDRAARAGYSGGVGEVLVTAGPSAQQLVDLWMSSPPHQSIIMGDPYSDIGVGCAVAPYTDPNGNTFQTALCVGMMGVPY